MCFNSGDSGHTGTNVQSKRYRLKDHLLVQVSKVSVVNDVRCAERERENVVF